MRTGMQSTSRVLGLWSRVHGVASGRGAKLLIAARGRCRASMAHIRQSRPWLSGESPQNHLRCSLFAPKLVRTPVLIEDVTVCGKVTPVILHGVVSPEKRTGMQPHAST